MLAERADSVSFHIGHSPDDVILHFFDPRLSSQTVSHDVGR